jgi:hypothetical protein
MSYTKTTISIYYKKSQKKYCSKIHSYEKVVFGKKGMHFFFPIILVVHCISFAPKCCIKGEGTNSGESKLKCGIHKYVGKRKRLCWKYVMKSMHFMWRGIMNI